MRDDALAIKRGYPPEAHHVVAVDYDGVIVPFGGLDAESEPFPEAIAGMRRLKARGYRLLILTSRMSPTWLDGMGLDADAMRARIADNLIRHGIPFDDITAEKRPAVAYLDDRAIRFREGEWPAIVDWLLFSEEEA